LDERESSRGIIKLMQIKDIYSFLDEQSPFELQEKWDNSGLIVGSMDDEFDEVYISLDIDLEVLSQVKENSLIITHHPLIFSGLKKVNFDSYSTKLLKELIKKDIKLISMHTNIDKTHLNRYVMEEVLGFKVSSESEFVLNAKIDMSFDDFCTLIKSKLGIEKTKVIKTKENIKSFALTTGSGMSLIPYIKTDCFITGDIKYHDAMEAKLRGISLIDIGHYESEIYFNAVMMGIVEKYLQKNEIKAIIPALKNPFEYR
jgi:dinuclear metal center YbgI/SA1388 family protein